MNGYFKPQKARWRLAAPVTPGFDLKPVLSSNCFRSKNASMRRRRMLGFHCGPPTTLKCDNAAYHLSKEDAALQQCGPSSFQIGPLCTRIGAIGTESAEIHPVWSQRSMHSGECRNVTRGRFVVVIASSFLFAGGMVPLRAQSDPPTLRVDYVNVDYHVHEIYLSDGSWHDADLTAMTGGPLANPLASIADLVDTIQNVTRIHYFGQQDSHVHEIYLSGGSWHDADLTAMTGGPLAEPQYIANVLDKFGNVVRVHYDAYDGDVHELYLANGIWQDFDLTANTGGPAGFPVQPIVNVLDTVENTVRVDYVGVPDRHVHEFYIAGGAWHDADLTVLGGGVEVSSNATSIADMVDTIQNIVRVHYIGNDLHVHEIYLANGAWHDYDLTAATGGPQAVGVQTMANVVDTIQNVIRVDYSASDHDVHEIYLSNGVWGDFDLTTATGGPQLGDAGTPIASIVDTNQGVMRVNYIDSGSHVHQFYISGAAWHDYDLTSATGGPADIGTIASVLDLLH